MSPLLEALQSLASKPAFARDVLAGVPSKSALAGEMLQNAALQMRWMPEDVAKATIIKHGSSPMPMHTYGINRGSLVSDAEWAALNNADLERQLGQYDVPVVKVKPHFVDVRNPLVMGSPAWNELSTDASGMFPQFSGYRMSPTTAEMSKTPYDALLLNVDKPKMIHLSNVSKSQLYRPRVIPADPELMADLYRTKLAKALMGR